jgi:outer membrane murein-binding lipoprotein Lpp
MQKTCRLLLILLAGAFLFCGCGRQEKINSQKIDALSAHIAQLEQQQRTQTALIQAELNALAPELSRVDNTYFEKNRDDALFYHTNTLFLLLTIGKQIESQLETAAAERQTQNTVGYNYHTNEITTMYLCAAQIEETLAEQQKDFVNSVNDNTHQQVVAVNDSLQKQIQQLQATMAAEGDEMARRKQMEAEISQMHRDLALILARLGSSNPPTAHP